VAAVRTRAFDALLAEGFDLDAHERALVHAAIERAGGNKTLAAKLLGITAAGCTRSWSASAIEVRDEQRHPRRPGDALLVARGAGPPLRRLAREVVEHPVYVRGEVEPLRRRLAP
jgi:hypothetical protein